MAGRLARLGEKIRNLKDQDLSEVISTRLLIYAARLIKEGIAPGAPARWPPSGRSPMTRKSRNHSRKSLRRYSNSTSLRRLAMDKVTEELKSQHDQSDRYFGIEFASIEQVLQIYCKALTGREVVISTANTPMAALRNIWWNQLASDNVSNGRIKASVPAVFMEYPAYDENFGWYKSAVTQQVAHDEFGSLDFDFDRESALFENLRYQIHGEEVRAVPNSINTFRYSTTACWRPGSSLQRRNAA